MEHESELGANSVYLQWNEPRLNKTATNALINVIGYRLIILEHPTPKLGVDSSRYDCLDTPSHHYEYQCTYCAYFETVHYRLADLKADTTYHITVRTRTNFGEGEVSDTLVVMTDSKYYCTNGILNVCVTVRKNTKPNKSHNTGRTFL